MSEIDQIGRMVDSLIEQVAVDAATKGRIAGCESARRDLIDRIQAVITERDDLRDGGAGKPLAGPESSERMTLRELLDVLHGWEKIASDKTCVSFAHLCYGASSLWYQSHMSNFRKINRDQRELSEFVLNRCGSLRDDFGAQVLELLKELAVKADVCDAVERLDGNV